MGLPSIEVRGLDYRYQPAGPPVLRGVDLTLEEGWRCLLVGANGAGKTTLLAILGGQYMVPEEAVRVLGRSAFHDTSLAREVAFLSGTFPFRGDVRVGSILDRSPGLDAARIAELVECLEVDRDWHMHRVSDGQRRRVQILLKLAHAPRVLLLDEVTTDLDVVVRSELLRLLQRESEERGATILYATHIFDGLDGWATHLCYLEHGRVARIAELDAIEELQALRRAGVWSPLHRLVEGWLRASR
jgi:CCR4-NOT complex subunit CAF16